MKVIRTAWLTIIIALKTIFIILFVGFRQRLPFMFHSTVLEPDFYLEIQFEMQFKNIKLFLNDRHKKITKTTQDINSITSLRNDHENSNENFQNSN